MPVYMNDDQIKLDVTEADLQTLLQDIGRQVAEQLDLVIEEVQPGSSNVIQGRFGTVGAVHWGIAHEGASEEVVWEGIGATALDVAAGAVNNYISEYGKETAICALEQAQRVQNRAEIRSSTALHLKSLADTFLAPGGSTLDPVSPFTIRTEGDPGDPVELQVLGASIDEDELQSLLHIGTGVLYARNQDGVVIELMLDMDQQSLVARGVEKVTAAGPVYLEPADEQAAPKP